ncbi:MAG: dihydropteroate synthase [Rhodospirillaceae bacterium]|jgi:5-methyltetrahydrofolate--homocysteine methyltransferase|nr:dihydropteroate synthase [Rhodospirillaceae bacterium]MBT3493691.1 dihydropteroate synthase [Rhodospirillaceae bacterium]MBT3780330.1 dihydropteroate synthase [Rhodospirillaceae bacterium]MBT3978419.1 dihydropteroate synthase [Rhodospirillaceae bacterium]MBT4564113.1 dihydropteroate synthase [Rhodospirillaceae bacterium]
MKIAGMEREFFVIGENVHTTRALLKRSKRVTTDENDADIITYTTLAGAARALPIPDVIKDTQDFQEGRVKHVKAALHQAMFGAGEAPGEGQEYIRAIVEKQEAYGADFLDINVDEVSLKTEEQIEAMQWLVGKVQEMASRPLSIDSSDTDVIAAGLAAYDGRNGPPMLNSASMERPGALDLAAQYKAAVIVTAAGEAAMPEGSTGRVTNAAHMIDAALAKGISAGDIYLDPLVFPVAVDPEFGRHCLDAIREIRQRYGPDIHITGGISNASFGVPGRKFINEAFLRLAVAAGGDSGIMDPVQNDPNAALAPLNAMDEPSLGLKLATDVVLGQDRDCKTYIKAWRKKQLA